MKLDLWGLLEGDIEFVEFQDNIKWEEISLNGRKINIREPIEFKGHAYKVDKDILISIKISYLYEEECNRCLETTTNKVDTELFAKLVEGNKESEYIIDEDSDSEDNSYEDVLYYENNNLDLKDYILEQVILSLPMKTICKDNCKGLCPKCGINLNNSECECVYEDIDPRLEVLKDFFPKK